jgi:periplasmic protein TonB
MKRRPTAPSDSPSQLSHSGQLIGWAVFGGLVLAGFVFGVVVGYDSPRPVVTAKAKKETPKPAETTEPKKEPAAKPAVGQTPLKKVDEPPVLTNPPKVDSVTVPRPAASLVKKVDSSSIKAEPKIEPKVATLTPVSFQKEVLPILRAHCLNCHGGGTGKPKGDVNLTSIAAMRRSPGKILVPGKPGESDVYTSITERDMPDGGRPKPTSRELETLRNWILSGAKERRRITRWRRISRLTASSTSR